MGNCLSCVKVDKTHTTPTEHNVPEERVSLNLVSGTSAELDTLNETGTVDPRRKQILAAGKDTQVPNIKDSKMMSKRYLPRIPSLPKSLSADKKELSESKIAALYELYKDKTCDFILSEGILRLCRDLDVEPDDFKVLVFAWKCNASTMCQFSREEFCAGCHAVGGDTVKSIQLKFPDLISQASDRQAFKSLYRFTYHFGLDSESDHKLGTDTAVALWKLVFSQSVPPILSIWITFLESHPSIRLISKDTWFMFLNFIESVSDDLGNYDENEAWPSLFDDFVEFQNDQANQNISKDFKIEN